jgi:SAM-dependent methyltransferase
MKDYITLLSRVCPVCLSGTKVKIHSQKFDSFSKGSLLEGYDVVLCRGCGGAFADNIPAQQEFDRYYGQMSKYEYDISDGIVNEYDADIFRKSAEFLAPLIERNAVIADVGCATGALLNEFKKRGFTNLTGFDPSYSCCQSGRRLYGIDIRQSTINQLRAVTDRFDVVMMTGVLEHLCDVETSIRLLKTLLKPGGNIYLGVPDASSYHRYFGAPFQYFSMEHVNFFAPNSLSNLMLRHGFETVKIQRFERYLGPKSIEPVVLGFFSPISGNRDLPKLDHDMETEEGLHQYLLQSREVEDKINTKIQAIVASRVPLIVWAVGTHTLRLLKTSSLAEANLVAFVDSNRNYQSKTLHGIPIQAPHAIKSLQGEILISSQVAETEIKNHLINELKWEGKIHTLYS